MLSKLSLWYLKILEATCRIEVQGLESLCGGIMGGFWHEDSLAMYLLLRRAADQGFRPSILVTADPRGDTIEKIVKAFGGQAIRISYEQGTPLASARRLARFFENGREILAVAMDGPLGPRHQPKRLPFLLGAKSACGFRGIKVEYSGKLRLKSRWDKYAIALPFSSIRFIIHDFGPVKVEQVADFEPYCETIRGRLAENITSSRTQANSQPSPSEGYRP